MNFQSLGTTGLVDAATEVVVTDIDAPVVTNTRGYAVKLDGKLKISTAQVLPSVGTDSSWSTGVVSFGNATAQVGKVKINGVQCPFVLKVNHSSGNSGDLLRKLVITFNGNQVYSDGAPVGGVITGYMANLDSTTTSTACIAGMTANIELYGYNGTNGSGVRIYDIKIVQ